MSRISFPQFLIISGSGQKVGKTFLATALIRTFSKKFPVLALKISPHVHDSLGNTTLRSTGEGIRIFQDVTPHSKNSGQFLEAGAQESFFMETVDGFLAEAFNLFMKDCNPMDLPVICESGALGSLVKPGILIFIARSTDEFHVNKLTTRSLADIILPATSFSAPEITAMVSLSDNGWKIGNR
ncbi:MAG: hypothetical protein ACOYNC_11215 [Bacteroidales bacterium]